MTDKRLVDSLRALLLADDAERRALERALHDGVQQQLIALAVGLQLARGLVETDPQGAVQLLDDARGTVGEALDELRAVAQRVHPPLLDSQGIVAAVRMAAAAAPLPTRVDGALDGAVPPEAAVTVYRCCVAALAAAEGEGGRAAISVRTRDGALEFEVVLAGAVIDPRALAALAGRAHALGGALEVAQTRVAGRLPLTS